MSGNPHGLCGFLGAYVRLNAMHSVDPVVIEVHVEELSGDRG